MLSLVFFAALHAEVSLAVRPAQPSVGDVVVMDLSASGLESCDLYSRRLKFFWLGKTSYLTVITAGDDPQSAGGPQRVFVRCWKSPMQSTIVARFNIPVRRPQFGVSSLRVPPQTVQLSETDQARIEKDARERHRFTSWVFPQFIEAESPLRAAAPVHGPLSSAFLSPRKYNASDVMKYHTGTDFAVAEGTPVIAPMPGVVALVQDTVLGGKTVLLHHGAGLLTSYLHLSEIAVEPGQWIDQGHVIGKSGRSGRATGPHLHWEGFWYGERFNAASLLTFAKLPSKIYRPLPTTAQLTLRGSLGTVKNVK